MPPAELLIQALTDALNRTAGLAPATVTVTATVTLSWRERLYTVPSELRLGLDEVAEALACSPRTVRRHIADSGLPSRRRFDEFVIVAGELRGWLEDNEQVVNRAARRVRAR